MTMGVSSESWVVRRDGDAVVKVTEVVVMGVSEE